MGAVDHGQRRLACTMGLLIGYVVENTPGGLARSACTLPNLVKVVGDSYRSRYRSDSRMHAHAKIGVRPNPFELG
jgi:hypothetical protein